MDMNITADGVRPAQADQTELVEQVARTSLNLVVASGVFRLCNQC